METIETQQTQEAVRKVGIVVHVVKERGFFFIFHEERRIFCHAKQWLEARMPSVDDVVSFEEGEGLAGKPTQALNAKPVVSAPKVGA